MLRIADPVPVAFCMPWHTRGTPFVTHGDETTFHGATCCFCERSIAAPESAKGKLVSCIYCGMDRGLLPAVEIEPFNEPEES